MQLDIISNFIKIVSQNIKLNQTFIPSLEIQNKSNYQTLYILN